MSTAQQLGLIGSSVRVQSLPTASAATFGEGNRFYTLIGQQDGYITGHTYRTVVANDVYSWEDIAQAGPQGEDGLPALVYNDTWGYINVGLFNAAIETFNRTPIVGEKVVIFSTENQYTLATIESVSETTVGVRFSGPIIYTKGADGRQGPQGIGVKSITSGTPTVVNDKTNTPITITLTDNTTVDLVVSAENGKDGTSATVDIVQTTGQSTTAVMSQKAVTDELNKKATKTYVDTQDDKKVDKAGGTITGDLAVNGGVTIGGNLTVSGTTTTVDSTTLQVKDKLIEVAHGNTEKLTTPAGIVAPKYDGTNSGALVFNGDGIASVGDVVLDASGNIDVTQSNLQPLATRTGLVNDNLVKYDGTNQTLVDTGKKISDLATAAQVNAKQNALTETQLAAVDSGITEAKRTKYDGYEEIINQKANSADLATVATSGSYNNLSNIPVINQDLTATNFMPVGGTYYRHIGASSDTFHNNTIYLYDGSHYISLRDIPTLQSSVGGLQQQVNNLQGQISGNESGSVGVILAPSDWVADSTISPFTVKATKTLSSETGGAVVMGQFDEISLAYFTTEAAKARSAGMCIGAVPQASGSEITFYAVTAPTEQIQAIVIITPTRIID